MGGRSANVRWQGRVAAALLSLLLLALAVPMSAALLAAAAPAVEAHAVALEAKYLVGRCIALVALLLVLPAC